MPNSRVIVRIATTNLRTEVRVNDIPVVQFMPGEAASPVAVPVNQYTVQGSNALSFLLHIGPRPGLVAQPWKPDGETGPYAGAASLETEVALRPEGEDATSDAPDPLLRYRWEGEAAPDPKRDCNGSQFFPS